jgi:hypothetical protein
VRKKEAVAVGSKAKGKGEMIDDAETARKASSLFCKAAKLHRFYRIGS